MKCPECQEWRDKPHCPSPTCAWKWCPTCDVDISSTGKSIPHVVLPAIKDGRP